MTHLAMIFAASMLIAAPPAAQGPYVVQFAHSGKADVMGARVQRIEKAGIHEVRIVSSIDAKKRAVYRIVSKDFPTLSAARLAASEARRMLRKAREPFDNIVIRSRAAGRPLVR